MTTDNKKSTGAYSPDKALAYPERLRQLREGKQPYPVHLDLILSDLCDLDCPTCAYRWTGYESNELFGEVKNGAYQHNPNRQLDRELVISVLNDCKAMGTQAVEFTGGGEPTIHPNAPELMEYAQGLGLDTALITNGLHLDRMGAAAVRTLWLRVSLDAATAATYAKVRPAYAGADRTKALANVERSAKNFDKACRAVVDAVEMRNQLNTDCLIGVGFVVQKANHHEVYEFAKLARELGADNVRISGVFSPEGAAYHTEYQAEAEELERKAKALDLPASPGRPHGFKVHGRFHEKMEDLTSRPDYKDCWYQHLRTYLGGDGNLYRCCVTSYNRQGLIGNIRDAGGFKALWDSKAKKFKYENFEAKSCTRCQFNDRNRSINAAVEAPELPPEPPGIVHKSFV